MAFPATAQDLAVELLISGVRVDITSSVRNPDGLDAIAIVRGRGDERQQVASSRCTLALNDVAGTFNTNNPASAYYRRIGLGTPLRIRVQENDPTPTILGVTTGTDRLVTSYTVSTTAGVRSGDVVLAFQSADADAFSLMKAPSGLDWDLLTSADNTADWGLSTKIWFRRATDGEPSSYTFYQGAQSDGICTVIALRDASRDLPVVASVTENNPGTSYDTPSVVPNGDNDLELRYVAGTAADGVTWAAPAGYTERSDQQSTVFTTGSVATKALASDAASGVQTFTATVSAGTLDVAQGFTVAVGADNARFTGEIASLRPEWDTTGNDVWVAVEASGILRWLESGEKPTLSLARRVIEAADPLLYWPVEDEADATAPASALPGGTPMGVVGTMDFAADTSVVGSKPLAKHNAASHLGGGVPAYTDTGEWSVWWIMRIPSEPAATMALMTVFAASGGVGQWILDLVPGSPARLFLRGYGPAATEVLADTGSDFTDDDGAELFGEQVLLRLSATRSGSDIAWTYTAYHGTAGQSTGRSATYSSATLGIPTVIFTGNTGYTDNLEGTSIGHIAFFTSDDALEDAASDIVSAYAGELAADRMVRVCRENGIAFAMHGKAADTLALGSQGDDSVSGLLTEAAEADGGILHEPRDFYGLAYRTRHSMYSQAAAVDLTYAAPTSHLSGVFRPVDDDNLLRNDVTATRPSGSSARFAIADGDHWHRSTEDPPDGIGVRDESLPFAVESDDQLNEIAQWTTHLGSWREPRFPGVAVQLARPVFTASVALTTDVQAADLGDLVVVDTTGGGGWLPPDQVQLLIQGVTEKLGRFQWDHEWNTTPGRAWEVWQLDTGGSTLAVAVSSGATSLKLATSSGREWSTTHEPYHLEIAGEAMTVTNMANDTPAFIAAGAAAHGNNASVAPALPAGITPDVGQLLLIWAAIRNSGTGTVNTPAGWATIADFGNCRLMGRYYVTGDAAPTVTFANGVANADTSAQMAAFSGLSMELASSVTGGYGSATAAAATQLNGSAQDIAYPACYVNRDGGVKLWLAWKQDDWTSVAGPGDAEIGEPDTTTGDDQGLAWYYDIYTTATDISAGTITVTGGAAGISRAVVLALRPLQTATVTRSVNGVTGSIAAAQAVHGWRLGLNAL